MLLYFSALLKKAAQEYRKMKDTRLMEFVPKMQVQLDAVDSLYKHGYDTLASSILDSAFQIGSKAKLINEFFIKVLAYHYACHDDQLDYNNSMTTIMLRKLKD